MSINDAVLLTASVASSTIMVLSRRKKKSHGAVSIATSIPLNVRISGLIEYRYTTPRKTFKVSLPFASEGFKGKWSCIKLSCGGWGCAYLCKNSKERVVFKFLWVFESIIEGGLFPTVDTRLLKKIISEAETVKSLNTQIS